MSTTALIIEIVVSGFFALLWLVILCAKLYGMDLEDIFDWLATNKDITSIIVLFLLALIYQLGWFMNYLSYVVIKGTMLNKLRRKIFNEDAGEYESIKTAVFADASSDLLKKLNEEHGIVRISRPGIINFFMLGIMLFIIQLYTLGIISFIFSVICIFQTRQVYLIYYKRIADYKKKLDLEK